MISAGGTYDLAFAVRDDTGILANAAMAALVITLPDGSAVTPDVANPPADTGAYLVSYLTTQAGRHTWRAATGSPDRTFTGEFDIAPAATDAIVSLAEAKAQLRIAADDLSADDQLLGYIEGITGAAEEYKHQVIVPRQFTDDPQLVFRARSFRLWNAPVLSLISVATWDGTQTWDVSQLHASSSGVVRVMAGPSLSGAIVPVYTAGLNPVPWRFKQGALVMLGHLWETQRGQGTLGSGVMGPEERYRQPGEFFTVPNKCKEWWGPPLPTVA